MQYTALKLRMKISTQFTSFPENTSSYRLWSSVATFVQTCTVYNGRVGLSLADETSFEGCFLVIRPQYRLKLYLGKAVRCITAFRREVLGNQRHC